jgi:Domain of unknown function (DUF3291)
LRGAVGDGNLGCVSDFHLAEFNIARLRRPLDHADTAEFVAALEPINVIAEHTPGFVWRLTDDDGNSSSYVPVVGIDDPLLIVNYSVWEDLESLRHFLYRSGHSSYLRRRREWFEPMSEASLVCWWTPAGKIPDVGEAYRRLQALRRDGPSPEGWPLTEPVPVPSVDP